MSDRDHFGAAGEYARYTYGRPTSSSVNRISKLEAENKRLRIALEAYADPTNWEIDTEKDYAGQRMWCGPTDGGMDVAVTALKPRRGTNT